jgi:nickel-dependent lactate racemase
MGFLIPHGFDFQPLEVSDSNLVNVAFPEKLEPSADPVGTLRSKIQHSIAEVDLGSKAKPNANVAISVTDRTRSTPLSTILPILLDELNGLSIRDQDVLIISGGGMHAADSDHEMAKTMGAEILARVEVTTNDPDNEALMTHLGTTTLGTDVEIHQGFAEADIKIGISNINPCMLAGWSGSAKMVQPAVASRKSIYQNHHHFVHPLMELGIASLMGVLPPQNPVRADIEECADISGIDFTINTVLDSDRKLVDVYCGDHLSAHRAAVEMMLPNVEVSLPEAVDILIAGVGDPALEVSLFQGGSRVCGGVDRYLKTGGTLIMVNACEEGIYEGFEHEEYRNWMQEMPTPEEIGNLVESGRMGGEKGCVLFTFSWLIHKMNCRIVLVSDGMSANEITEIHLSPADTVQAAYDETAADYNSDHSVGIMPYAGLVLPKLKAEIHA